MCKAPDEMFVAENADGQCWPCPWSSGADGLDGGIVCHFLYRCCHLSSGSGNLIKFRHLLCGSPDPASNQMSCVSAPDLYRPVQSEAVNFRIGMAWPHETWRMQKHWWILGLRSKSFGMVLRVMSSMSRSASACLSSLKLRRLLEKINKPPGRRCCKACRMTAT